MTSGAHEKVYFLRPAFFSIRSISNEIGESPKRKRRKIGRFIRHHSPSSLGEFGTRGMFNVDWRLLQEYIVNSR
jgi:hypothetical protein